MEVNLTKKLINLLKNHINKYMIKQVIGVEYLLAAYSQAARSISKIVLSLLVGR
jgi:hypothetical protein